MHRTDLLQNGTRVAKAHTIMPLIGGRGQWVHTADGAFHVMRVYDVTEDRLTGNHDGFAEVLSMSEADLPAIQSKPMRPPTTTRTREDNYGRGVWF